MIHWRKSPSRDGRKTNKMQAYVVSIAFSEREVGDKSERKRLWLKDRSDDAEGEGKDAPFLRTLPSPHRFCPRFTSHLRLWSNATLNQYFTKQTRLGLPDLTNRNQRASYLSILWINSPKMALKDGYFEAIPHNTRGARIVLRLA